MVNTRPTDIISQQTETPSTSIKASCFQNTIKQNNRCKTIPPKTYKKISSRVQFQSNFIQKCTGDCTGWHVQGKYQTVVDMASGRMELRMVSTVYAPFVLDDESGEVMQMRVVGSSGERAEIVGCRWMPEVRKNQWTCVMAEAKKSIIDWYEEPFLSVRNSKMTIIQKKSGTRYIKGNKMTMTGSRQFKEGILWKLG